jgi:hypothetical protein
MSDETTTNDDEQGDHRMNAQPKALGDEALWGDLAAMWDARDPMPSGLVEQVLVALATEDLDAEYELLHLVSRTGELVGARGSGDAITISFSGGSCALLLRVSGIGGAFRRVDGWVTPAREMRVTVKQKSRSWDAQVDAQGRFEIAHLPGGLSRFWLVDAQTSEQSEEQALFATPTFDL